MDGILQPQNFICVSCGEQGKHTRCDDCWREIFKKEFDGALARFEKALADMEAAHKEVVNAYETSLQDYKDLTDQAVQATEDTKQTLEKLFPKN